MSRQFYPGMGLAVAKRTILRQDMQGKWETWSDVAKRVAYGNSLLCSTSEEQKIEFEKLEAAISNATLLMSGRHLQHGDSEQPNRNMEVFTNCATSSASFIEFYMLLNGSGVGRCYDDDMMIVNWDNSPTVRCVLSENHADYDYSAHESVRDAKHKYGSGRDVMWFKVPDSREGWAKTIELWENSTFEKIHKDKMLILDFSEVRCKGSPISGMQDRPSSGPIPLMNAIRKAATLKGANLAPWLQNMYIDHYLAECVLVGGARRAARMATKYWKDQSIFDFITIKRPIEYNDMKLQEIIEYRKQCSFPPTGFLWSANNSVLVDQDFWDLLKIKRTERKFSTPLAIHARKVFRSVTEAAYANGTGEPGFINAHMLVQNDDGIDELDAGDYIGSKKFILNEDTEFFMARLIKRAKKKKFHTITNPCGEIALSLWSGVCVIADVVPYFANTIDEAEEVFRITTRSLIRVNTMDSIYNKEIKRTNRIGVGLTGVHEFAWKFFKYGFRDLINEEKSKDFWLTLARFSRAAQEEAINYSHKLGVNVPHTITTIKPSGTVSKLFGLTEGWHLPSMEHYLRWVQFRNDDPLVKRYIKSGYPYKELVTYEGTTVIGFPTTPIIGELGLDDKFVSAAQATPEEQYEWLRLGEKYWLKGTNEEGESFEIDRGNQISYTLKYNPKEVDFKQFRDIIMKNQESVRCCSVMPQEEATSYEYQPEQSVTKTEYEACVAAIKKTMEEDISVEHVDCDEGACPIDFNTGNISKDLIES